MSALSDQLPVIEFLEYHAFGETERIDTHAAIVFLEGQRAWKIKKAVSPGYLDFSTLDARRMALETELLLNRKNAPGLYRYLHRITRNGLGKFEIGGSGETVEWLLQMQRLPQDDFLDRWIPRHGRSEWWLRELANAVCRSHDTARVSKRSSVAGLLRIVSDNDLQLCHEDCIFPVSDAKALIARHIDALSARADLLGQRTAEGRVRRCHGDLHLGNIAMHAGRPVLLDCLEFDEDFATMDVLYDLALLLMDLQARGMRREADDLTRYYLDCSPQDADASGLLPLFISMRAAMRAHVTAMRAAEDARARSMAQAYFSTAVSSLDALN